MNELRTSIKINTQYKLAMGLGWILFARDIPSRSNSVYLTYF